MSTLRERLVAVLKEHDLRRWMRMLKGDRSFDCLRCYCGEKIYEDSNEAMLGHVADALAAEAADAPLPLQRTLPDEQFKGAVVERIGTERALGQELSDSIGLYALALESKDDEEIAIAIKRCVAAKRAWDAAVAADMLMGKEPRR